MDAAPETKVLSPTVPTISGYFVHLPASTNMRMAAVTTSRAFLYSHHYHSLPLCVPSFFRVPTFHRNPILLSAVKCLQSSSRNQNVVDILEERGLLESLTSEQLRHACSNPSIPPLKVYCGFDPTAESLHLGNLLGLIVLSWFQKCGHQTVALIGGATARVGDPSGKSLERPELSLETLSRNTSGISNTVGKILGSSGVSIFNNYDWWKEVRLLDFLKDVGRFARVGSMMAKESVKKRLESEQGMSYTEFTYQLLQGYDFLYLFRNEGINVQIGDADVVRFLKILTFLDMNDIRQIESDMKRPRSLPNTAQRRLAEEVTRFVHGQDGLDEALKATEAMRPGADTKLDWNTMQATSEDVPSCSFPYHQVLDLSVVDLSVSSGLFDSKSAARRLLKQGGLYLNNSRVDSESKRIEPQDVVDGKLLLLSAGKKNKQLGLPVLGIVAAAAITFYVVSFSELSEKSFRDLENKDYDDEGYKPSPSSRVKRARRKANKQSKG
ncbi:hypothetical protein ACLB2K_058654 [Fragaria x ananassa]